jgi:hypothetical protein
VVVRAGLIGPRLALSNKKKRPFICGDYMAERDDFLAMALELLRRAETELDPKMRAGLEELAEHYRQLAEQNHDGGLIIELALPSKPQN